MLAKESVTEERKGHDRFARGTQERRRREGGVVIVEFSLSLLPLLGFVFLLMGLAWIIFGSACVQEAVREGARTAITCPQPSLNNSIQQTVETYSFGFVNAANVSRVFSVQYLNPTTLARRTGTVYSGDIVTVSVSNLSVYTFAPILRPNSPILLGANASDIMSCVAPANQ